MTSALTNSELRFLHKVKSNPLKLNGNTLDLANTNLEKLSNWIKTHPSSITPNNKRSKIWKIYKWSTIARKVRKILTLLELEVEDLVEEEILNLIDRLKLVEVPIKKEKITARAGHYLSNHSSHLYSLPSSLILEAYLKVDCLQLSSSKLEQTIAALVKVKLLDSKARFLLDQSLSYFISWQNTTLTSQDLIILNALSPLLESLTRHFSDLPHTVNLLEYLYSIKSLPEVVKSWIEGDRNNDLVYIEPDCVKLLGIQLTEDYETAKARYRKLLKELHPDLNNSQSPEKVIEIIKAWRTWCNIRNKNNDHRFQIN